MTDPSPELTEALSMARRLGALGPGSVGAMVEHSRVFVDALDGVTGVVGDIGSGVGVPGLVIAVERPDLELVLIDRRQQRSDLCRRLVARLGLEDRVRVLNAEVREVASDHSVSGVDAVVARSFGEPFHTLAEALRLVRPGGRIVISEPPEGDRWDRAALGEHGAALTGWVHRSGSSDVGVSSRAVILERLE